MEIHDPEVEFNDLGGESRDLGWELMNFGGNASSGMGIHDPGGSLEFL